MDPIGSMGVAFDQTHDVLLNCRTVFVACGLTKSRVLFLHHPDQSYIVLYFSKRFFYLFTCNLTILAQIHILTTPKCDKLGWINILANLS